MGHTSEMNHFLDVHRSELVAAGVPEILWPTLFKKLTNEIFDAGEYFQILNCEEFDEHEPPRVLQSIKALTISNPDNIFLIDHAWTFRLDTSKVQLKQNLVLVERLCDMFGIEKESSEKVEKIFHEMWKFVNWYSINNAEEVEDRLPCWYTMDEVGSAIWHSDTPNCRIVPFIYAKDQLAYSLLFLIEDVEEGDFMMRDFAEGISDKNHRSAYLTPWQPISQLQSDINPPIPPTNYFLSGHIAETLPKLSNLTNSIVKRDVLKVFSQYELINQFLISTKFSVVNNENDADILWYTKHFKDFEELSNTPSRFVNQFPFEYVITVKDLLCIICRRHPSSKQWIPTSYNLLTELHYFVTYFQSREKDGLDNYWIIKPYNLARGLDIYITDNLNFITRLSATGAKIVQKYITNPVLFYRSDCHGKVKFDVRYVVLLKSTKPLQAYIYRKFFLRFANKPFALNDFDVYEKHFTVMNYATNVQLKHIKCEEFLIEFELQYPNYSWNAIEKAIRKMLRDILDSATSVDPPCGISESPQSRALYAADIMLEWCNGNIMEPRILEINFMPDCKRACDYYPEFYDDIFEMLFFNDCLDKFLPL